MKTVLLLCLVVAGAVASDGDGEEEYEVRFTLDKEYESNEENEKAVKKAIEEIYKTTQGKQVIKKVQFKSKQMENSDGKKSNSLQLTVNLGSSGSNKQAKLEETLKNAMAKAKGHIGKFKVDKDNLQFVPIASCWSHCGGKGGICGKCGSTGVCCKKGVKDERGCDGNNGCSGYHCCAKSASCWRYCGRGGFCDWCGSSNACCQKGVKDGRGCDGKNGCSGYHCCAKSASCWSYCGGKGGICGWCGSSGACCQKGVKDGRGCDGTNGCPGYHCCAKSGSKEVAGDPREEPGWGD